MVISLLVPSSWYFNNLPSNVFVQFVHRIFPVAVFNSFSLSFFFKFEMYKYNSLLIYTIKLGRNLGHENEKKNVKKSSDKFDWNLALSTRCRETTCRLSCADLFLCVCVKWIQNLRHVIFNCDLWTALRWMVFAAQPYTVVFLFFPHFIGINILLFFTPPLFLVL